MIRYNFLLAILAVMLFAAGCTTPQMTNTKRSAVETLLLSDAVDKAMMQFDLRRFAFKKMFIDSTNLVAEDKPYVIAALAQALGDQAIIRVNDKKDAEYIAEIYCGTLGTDHDKFMIGMPPVAVPIPFSGPVKTPEMPLYKNNSQKAFCKLRLSIWSAGGAQKLYSSRYMYSVSYLDRCCVIGFPFNRTNLPSYFPAITEAEKHSDSDARKKLMIKVDYYNEPVAPVVDNKAVEAKNKPATAEKKADQAKK